MLGVNARLDTLQAAVLSVKLRHLDGWTARGARRRPPTTRPSAEVDGIEPIRVDRARPPVYHQYVVRVAERARAAALLGSTASRRGSTTPCRCTSSPRSPTASLTSSRTPRHSPRRCCRCRSRPSSPLRSRAGRRDPGPPRCLLGPRLTGDDRPRHRRGRPDRFAPRRSTPGARPRRPRARQSRRSDPPRGSPAVDPGGGRVPSGRRAGPLADGTRLAGVDEVYHQAAFGGFTNEISRYYDANATGTAMIFDVIAARGLDVRKVVAASSQAIYGEGFYTCPEHGTVQPGMRSVARLKAAQWESRCPFCDREAAPALTHEDARWNGETPYAVSKLAEERTVLGMGRRLGLATVALRYAVDIGPRQSVFNPYTGVVSICSTQLLNGRRPVVYEEPPDARLHLRARHRGRERARDDGRPCQRHGLQRGPRRSGGGGGSRPSARASLRCR